MEDMLGSGRPSEGESTKMIESQTAQLPSVAFLGAAVGSMLLSLVLLTAGRRELANFVGQWAPTILIMGLYNKLVKQRLTDMGGLASGPPDPPDARRAPGNPGRSSNDSDRGA
jgi:hypothetical protein